MIDWAQNQLDMTRLTKELYEDLTKRDYEEADAKLTQIIIEARLIRAFVNTINRNE